MRKILALSFLFVGMIATASAGDCRNGVCATPVVQTVVTPTALTLPIYGAAYSSATTDDETKQLLKLLIEEVKGMRAELSKGSIGAPSALSKDGPDPLAILKESCANCHTGEKSKGGFSLYTDKGELVRLSPADRREVSKRVQSGNMPPAPGRLSVEQKEALIKGMK